MEPACSKDKAAPSGLEEGQYDQKSEEFLQLADTESKTHVFHTLHHPPLNKFQNQNFNSAVDSGQKVFPKSVATATHSWRININQTGKYRKGKHLTSKKYLINYNTFLQ